MRDKATQPGGRETPAAQTRELGFTWPGQQHPMTFPDIRLDRGEHLFIHGPSGSGKSTLLNMMAGLAAPGAGDIDLLGTRISALKAGVRDRFRADHIGVIFQQFNLVPYLSALANVTLPCRLSARRLAETANQPEDQARQLLKQLAIPEDHWHRGVTRLSIGQQQRVAAARALMGAPGIILADEPTSALDTDNRDRFLDLLLELAERSRSSVLFVSHDRSLAKHFHQQVALGEAS